VSDNLYSDKIQVKHCNLRS